MSLPPLADLANNDALHSALSTLFEPTPALEHTLLPAVSARLSTSPAQSYGALVDLCAEVALQWDWGDKAAFVAGHPMIGEVKGLSAHSAKEQGVKPTAPVVLARLAHLNALYNAVFPGLRYITFVNGRTRAQIVPELEEAIGLPLSPVPLPDDFEAGVPSLESDEVRKLVRDPSGEQWKAECDRAIADVWLIAHSRLQNMGLE
ncbi:putative allantoinase 1 [Vanrija pseudolonga]|uniref:Allantoinase 1 n=1 Tax=Vanrija pseudolonga TaxID=143232 RepID=A0AAF0Y561_9TREE|nr:putative allantoinase 1 [Vanrija pseudolonga]